MRLYRDRYNIILGKDFSTIPTDLASKISTSISDYLVLDIDQLIQGTDSAIFGGATRDAIAGQKIHDVDIMCLPRAAGVLSERLLSAGFEKVQLHSVDISCLYANISVINEPWTFVNSGRIVQLIRPRIKYISDLHAIQELSHCLSNVDMTSSGVTYSTQVEVSPYWTGIRTGTLEAGHYVVEVCENAIEHCRNKQFMVLPDNVLHQKDRIAHRIAKLLSRGWKIRIVA